MQPSAEAGPAVPGKGCAPVCPPILFNGKSEVYGCFSNFSDHAVLLPNSQGVLVSWPTTEHYFQAQKFPGSPHEEAIRCASNPAKAKKMGGDRSKPLRPDWEAAKDEVMYTAVHAKFSQHRDLRQLLLSTGDAMIAEHTARDRIWGDGGDGRGQNRLGKVLMRVRAELRAARSATADDGQHVAADSDVAQPPAKRKAK